MVQYLGVGGPFYDVQQRANFSCLYGLLAIDARVRRSCRGWAYRYALIQNLLVR